MLIVLPIGSWQMDMWECLPGHLPVCCARWLTVVHGCDAVGVLPLDRIEGTRRMPSILITHFKDRKVHLPVVKVIAQWLQE